MIKGMTGFGYTQIFDGKVRAVIEIKSLNHRYFDISYYLPIGFAALEEKIRQIVQAEIERGRVTVSLKIVQKSAQHVHFNKDLVKTYLKHAKQLSKEFHLENDLTMAHLVQLPGVLETKETLVDPQQFWPNVEKGLKKALNGLVTMREREGRSLTVDIKTQLRIMSSLIKKIQGRTKALVKEKSTRLSKDEFVSFQKSTDINEEISRFGHYIAELNLLLKDGASAGKRIDFIAQEMQRETNTMGSKVQDQIVSNAVIALKSKIEKIREQSQNVE